MFNTILNLAYGVSVCAMLSIVTWECLEAFDAWMVRRARQRSK